MFPTVLNRGISGTGCLWSPLDLRAANSVGVSRASTRLATSIASWSCRSPRSAANRTFTACRWRTAAGFLILGGATSTVVAFLLYPTAVYSVLGERDSIR
jgi:hypothetical protein